MNQKEIKQRLDALGAVAAIPAEIRKQLRDTHQKVRDPQRVGEVRRAAERRADLMDRKYGA